MKYSSTHVPVLKDEVVHYLTQNNIANPVYFDVTFGAGGHTRALLQSDPTCRVVAFDWDKQSLDTWGLSLKDEFGDRLTLVWGNFAQLNRLAASHALPAAHGVCADFGTSRMQLTEGEGFSLYHDAFLDMRMSKAHQKITAAELVNKASSEKLEDIFRSWGQERYARRIARAIVAERARNPFRTSGQLANFVAACVPKHGHSALHPATRVFQALRICVNKELDNIAAFLTHALPLLCGGGVLVCISFHSLEDTLVKHCFKGWQQQGLGSVMNDEVITPSDEEKLRNPSSRSAKLRAFVKNEV